MTPFPENSTIVLVHGAWADGSSWNNLILPLQRHRLKVICAQLTLNSLSEDVAALRRTLERTSGPVVLAGHAYGGAVIGATHDNRVKSLVFVAALAPDEGETVAQLFYRDEEHPKALKLAPDSNGFLWMPEDGFHDAVAHKASIEQTTIMAAVQRPIAVRCIEEPAPVPAWKEKPSWFLLAQEDRMINPNSQQFMANRMGARIRPKLADHTPMLTAPDLVIDLILEAARETLAP